MHRPTATIETLKRRDAIIRSIRQFFYARDVMEVETPLLSHATVTDPYLHSFRVSNHYYLQTSPEYAMKRLLASGSGSIFQMGKAFREDEQGRFHNPEFTMLEWYRVGFNHHDLMDEMTALLRLVLGGWAVERFSYAELFQQFCDLNPLMILNEDLSFCVKKFLQSKADELDLHDRDLMLQLLMTEYIEPQLAEKEIVFIYDYPTSQAALAKIRYDVLPVAERFEVYAKGIELANGFHELTEAKEQRARFKKDLAKRKELGYPEIPIDENLLSALDDGLPNCAGVALGVDRLIMLAIGKKDIKEVIAFPTENA